MYYGPFLRGFVHTVSALVNIHPCIICKRLSWSGSWWGWSLLINILNSNVKWGHLKHLVRCVCSCSSSCARLAFLLTFSYSVNLISSQSVYRPIILPVCLSLSPASLRVSSVSVVRSDHSSICVSWRPVSAVDGYRIVIQSVKGKSIVTSIVIDS